MKQLTFEGWWECGGPEMTAGKVCAFVPVLHTEPGFDGVALGVAMENEPGYVLVPIHWVRGEADEYELMKDHAAALNKEYFHLDVLGAALVVASSMRGAFPRYDKTPGT